MEETTDGRRFYKKVKCLDGTFRQFVLLFYGSYCEIMKNSQFNLSYDPVYLTWIIFMTREHDAINTILCQNIIRN